MKTLCKHVFGMRIICADQCKSTYPFAHLQKYLYRGCFRWIGKNAKKLKRTMFQQSAANLSFFAYRLHNEMLDKKINSTHDCLDYIKLFNFWESKFQEISPLPRTARACSTSKAHGSNYSAAVHVSPRAIAFPPLEPRDPRDRSSKEDF